MITRADVDGAFKEAFVEAVKDRFGKIAANEITAGPDEGRKELRNTLLNLRTAHAQACEIVEELWPPSTP